MNLEEHLNSLQAKFRTATQHEILPLQKEYSQALDAFKKWAKTNNVIVSQGENRCKSELVIHRFEWTGPHSVRIID